MQPILYSSIKVPRSKKKRIWKKWGLKRGEYRVSANVKTNDRNWYRYRVSYTVNLLRCVAKGERKAKIPIAIT
jgi:hypothetical protein